MTRDEQLKRLRAFSNDVIGTFNIGRFINRDFVNSIAEKHGLTVGGKKADWLPERSFYRVALFKDEQGLYTRTADDRREEAKLETDKRLVKWLTDWQEYEV
ncbi:MAG: hypothetical protein KIT80_23615 [Chitinophagaceae bacterium]|nr:hypothetical protein [Nitrosomonas sp.]MCW5929929.1 hypothetical protein [Chitinophagaceae bacterium]